MWDKKIERETKKEERQGSTRDVRGGEKKIFIPNIILYKRIKKISRAFCQALRGHGIFVLNSCALENDENVRTSGTIVSFASSRLSLYIITD